LKEIEGKKVLEYIVEKVQKVNNIDGFCIATSTEEDDDAVADFCIKNNLPFFRGDLKNVAERFYKCSVENRYDAMVRVNGDNIFTDAYMIQDAVERFVAKKLEFLSNVKGRTYPKGMSIEIVQADVYKKALGKISESDYYSEHVMPYFYDHDSVYKTEYMYHENNQYKNIDLALDTEEDFQLATSIIQQFTKPHKEYSCDEVVELYKKTVEISEEF
jgi:spore coat polysaccharide biosynthesis protein SpsF